MNNPQDTEVADQVDAWLGFSLEPNAIRLIQMDYHLLDERGKEVAFLYLLGQAIEARHLANALKFILQEESGNGV